MYELRHVSGSMLTYEYPAVVHIHFRFLDETELVEFAKISTIAFFFPTTMRHRTKPSASTKETTPTPAPAMPTAAPTDSELGVDDSGKSQHSGMATCQSNKDAHPGKPNMPSVHRCTKAKMIASREQLKKQQKEELACHEEGIQKLKAMQKEIEIADKHIKSVAHLEYSEDNQPLDDMNPLEAHLLKHLLLHQGLNSLSTKLMHHLVLVLDMTVTLMSTSLQKIPWVVTVLSPRMIQILMKKFKRKKTSLLSPSRRKNKWLVST
jgi:hypothetical protein